MADLAHLRKLDEGVKEWNDWRSKNPELSIDLSEVSLQERTLSGINLSGANLRDSNLRVARFENANFTNANLKRTDFFASNLTGANFSGADLAASNFFGAKLVGANLTNTRLETATFRYTSLEESDFSGASMGLTVFVGFGLDSVKGLDTIKHVTPSNIGVDTILHSKQPIPRAFLKGAGIPEDTLAILDSINREAIAFYSCFISYSTLDQDFADRLHKDLQANGVRCWFAPQSIQGGRKVHEQINEALKLHDKLLLVLSNNSMESSWVKAEIAETRARELKENRRCLFPIRLVSFEVLRDWRCFDADTGKDSAREIREYFIPDFSDWKDNDSYKRAFERLLKDLKATQNTQ